MCLGPGSLGLRVSGIGYRVTPLVASSPAIQHVIFGLWGPGFNQRSRVCGLRNMQYHACN